MILITGATGKTGSPVVKQLLEKDFRGRAFVRRRDERSERLQAVGAKVVLEPDVTTGSCGEDHRDLFV